MNEITIRKVTTSNELMQFIKFPWKIYKDDPYWVPHLIMDRKKILDKKKNPFFEHADAEYFLAYKNNEIVGRIAAIKNDLHNEYHKDKVGFFGFFECINNQEVANKLLNTAKDWLKEKGFDTMRGPVNPSTNDECGLLIEGFEDSPRILMTYNPKYYINLLENYGLKKAKDLNAYAVIAEKMLTQEKIKRVSELTKQRYNIKITELDMKNFDKELEKVKYIYNKAWAPNWGFVPMTDSELNAMAKDLKQIAEPKLILFAEIENKVVGFSLVMLDYNQIFKDMNGKLFPFGIFKLLTGKKKINWARIITLGIIPEYQKKGIDGLLYWEIVNRAGELGITRGEASWILEDNEMMNRAAKLMNAEVYKTYRIYDISI